MKKQRTNPCKKCLVQSMCLTPCRPFIGYLQIRLDYKYDDKHYIWVAQKIREGRMILHTNDRKLRFTDEPLQ